MEKRPDNPVLNIPRILFLPLLIIIAIVAFFFAYNTYLIDNSLESLIFSLNKVSTAQTLEETQNLKMILGEALIKEVSAERLKLILSNVVKSKEAQRSKILLRMDAVNEKVKSALLKFKARLYGKRIKKGIEVSDLSLLDKARALESNWQIEEAISNYNAFIAQYPAYIDMGWVSLRLGYAYLKIGNLKNAEANFASVAKGYSGQEEALIAQLFLNKIKEIKRALKNRVILLKKIETAKTDEEKQKIYYDIGVIISARHGNFLRK